ncbi:AraC family transcriptional regulator [Brachybacterium sp. P6-10-X1]|uniref:helix-turn-helix domain-containing protein n=1 Tax=Brachybacterium sp. P6-10-X1 TaxID=1903186 RepID=UPI00155F765B|nr:AraC family transcriptional regulator [Brachybacterium sp. P6-10-X1]
MSATRPPEWAHYVPPAHALRDSGLCCVGAGEQSGQLPAVRRRGLSQHALVLITSGSGRYVDAYGAREVSAPAWIWLTAGQWHEYGPGRDGWTEHWVLFDGIGTRAYRSHLPRARGGVQHLSQDSPLEVDPIFDALHEATSTAGRRGQLMAACLVHRLIGVVVGATAPVAEDQTVMDAVSASATENLTVPERAARAGLTLAQLRTHVRRSTGLTPHELVLSVRLSRAQHLLARTDLSISRIATDVGFDDPSYFTRLFVRRVGVAPSTFRVQQQRRTAGASDLGTSAGDVEP